MNNSRRLIFALIAAISFSTVLFSQKKGSAQVEVKPTSQITDAGLQSLTYMLPQTIIQVDITMEKRIMKAGPYYRYSQRLLNLSAAITEDSEEWLIKDVRISTAGKADKSKQFSIFATGNTSANMLTLSSDGVLMGINNTPIFTTELPTSKSNLEPLPADVNFDNVALSEDLLYKTSSAAMAQEAANMVYKLRKSRVEILSGEMENLPPDGEAYKTVLHEIEKQEKDFISLFAGKTITLTQTQRFELTPDPLSSYANHVLCRFNKQKGLVDAMDVTGTPIYLKLDIVNKDDLKNKQLEPSKNPQKNGLFYTLPSWGTVQILDKNTTIISEKVALAQYGQLVSMPASILEKEGVVVEISPATGALISVGSK